MAKIPANTNSKPRRFHWSRDISVTNNPPTNQGKTNPRATPPTQAELPKAEAPRPPMAKTYGGKPIDYAKLPLDEYIFCIESLSEGLKEENAQMKKANKKNSRKR